MRNDIVNIYEGMCLNDASPFVLLIYNRVYGGLSFNAHAYIRIYKNKHTGILINIVITKLT